MSFQYLNRAKKIICIGRNYAAHIKELNNPTPKQPFFFLKPTSAIITPLHDLKQAPHLKYSSDSISSVYTFNGLNKATGKNPSPIYIPKGVDVHHEVEIALVIKKTLSNVPQGVKIPMSEYLEGVSLALDLTARNVQDEAKHKGLPWSIPKGFDTFLPISELIPTEVLKIDDTFQDSFELSCKVNNETRQHGSSALMLNGFNKILQHISTMMTLEAGDIVLTGTPSGVGPLRAGDSIECQLSQDGVHLVKMDFDCLDKPGPYEFKET